MAYIPLGLLVLVGGLLHGVVVQMLIVGSILGCLDPILTIAACLSYKSPFSYPFGRQEVRQWPFSWPGGWVGSLVYSLLTYSCSTTCPCFTDPFVRTSCCCHATFIPRAYLMLLSCCHPQEASRAHRAFASSGSDHIAALEAYNGYARLKRERECVTVSSSVQECRTYNGYATYTERCSQFISSGEEDHEEVGPRASPDPSPRVMDACMAQPTVCARSTARTTSSAFKASR